MFNIFRRKKLKDALFETKKVIVNGVSFEIKKLNILNYIDGSKALVGMFDVYKSNPDALPDIGAKKLKEHYVDVIMASVQFPKLTRKENEASDEIIWVENIFLNWELAEALYSKIMEFTYGKKKMKLYTSQERK